MAQIWALKVRICKKKTLFGGSFCKFKGEAPISLRNDPDFRVQRPKKPIVEQISCSPVKIQPNPYFDWSIKWNIQFFVWFLFRKSKKYSEYLSEYLNESHLITFLKNFLHFWVQKERSKFWAFNPKMLNQLKVAHGVYKKRIIWTKIY